MAISEIGAVNVPQPGVAQAEGVTRGSLEGREALRLDTVPPRELTERETRRLTREEEAELLALERELLGDESGDRRAFGLSLASLLLSTVGFLGLTIVGSLIFFPPLGLAASIAGIVLAAIALKKHKRSGRTYRGRGLAIAGLILGILFTAAMLALLTLIFLLFW